MTVQAGHAIAEFLLHGHFSDWNNGTLICLGVKGLPQLENYIYKLKRMGISFVTFKEPDLNNEPTAIATDEYCELFRRTNLL
jgi:hypothetical protein